MFFFFALRLGVPVFRECVVGVCVLCGLMALATATVKCVADWPIRRGVGLAYMRRKKKNTNRSLCYVVYVLCACFLDVFCVD